MSLQFHRSVEESEDPTVRPRLVAASLLAGVCLVLSALLAGGGWAGLALLPSGCALLFVFLFRSAFAGLLLGAVCGAFLIAEGRLDQVLSVLLRDQFLPLLGSDWKLAAILFTLILGGFVSLVEAGGGLQSLLRKVLGREPASRRRTQLAIVGFGGLVFFDGLANTMLIGRMMRSAADRCRISREKLAYLADATGSAVACLAFISTWIAFQLSMIREGYAQLGLEVSAYRLFLLSVPANFYCWFALVMVLVCILREYHPGPMGRAEAKARQRLREQTETEGDDREGLRGHWLTAIIPIAVLAFSIPVLSYLIGSESLWPFSLPRFAEAYAAAEAYVPQILVLACLLATAVAAFAYRRALRANLPHANGQPGAQSTSRVFLRGVREIAGPVCILLAAWMLGRAISALGAGDLISGLLVGQLDPALLPLVVFLTGSVVSFTTGTSWGTMAVLMPLALPVALTLGGAPIDPAAAEPLAVATIAAVFSGAVFGDHCSPFSDTTIVASIAAGTSPVGHVRTQLPYALLAGFVAALLGFLPLGLGLPPWPSLLAGALVLTVLPSIGLQKRPPAPVEEI